MKKSDQVIEKMDKFQKTMFELYDMAEGLRDAAEGKDKDLFNETRKVLYDLRYKAREQFYDWKEGEA